MSTATTALECHLASACNCAYDICVKDGSFHVQQPYYDGVQWSGAPQAFSAANEKDPVKRKINGCLVGASVDGLVVAFRGTLPPGYNIASWEDWWQDIVDSKPIAPPHRPDRPPIPGKVHSGFWEALDSLWPSILPAIQEGLAKSPKPELYVTGHSKGGPLATLAAARLYFEYGISATGVTTFASPHPGDVAFIGGFPDSIPVVRYENYLDIVPFLPPTAQFFELLKEIEKTPLGKEFCNYLPSICKVVDEADSWNYAALGTLRYVESSGTVVGESSPFANPYFRLAEIADHLLAFERIAAAHCIACKAKGCAGGYLGAACAGSGLCDGPIDPDPCPET